jgi:HSP20 family protein
MPWDPTREFAAWQERLGRLAPHATESWSPAIDVYETGATYVVTAELPGLTRDEIDLALEESRLTIRAHRMERSRPNSEIVRFHQVERGHGGFARTFEFAVKIDVDKVSADLADGVLYITLPKIAPPPARRIEVR